MSDVTRAEVCVTACADAFRDVGEIQVSPIGLTPGLGARLAYATFSPDIVLTDGDCRFMAELGPFGVTGDKAGVVEGWMPYRRTFEVLWRGRRQVMMGASQIDRYGNQNISQIGGTWDQPQRQLIGSRGAPGNTVYHRTDYWIHNHGTRVFVPKVDYVSGVGYDSAAEAGPTAQRFHHLGVIVTNLAVLDFDTPDHRMRLRSYHPGVTVDEVQANTGFELVTNGAGETRLPADDELSLIRESIDPKGMRNREVPG